MEHSGFVRVADVGDLVSARVAAALMESAGISVRLHGESLGPYPMTVGRMAVTQIWVPESDVEMAIQVLTEAEIEHALGVEVRGGAVADPGALPMKIVALVEVGILCLAVVVALMRVF